MQQENGKDKKTKSESKKKIGITGKLLGSSIVISFIGIVCFGALLVAMLVVKI